MRVSIRVQLGTLVLLTVLVALAVVAIATWITNYNFVLSITSSRLSLTASLKASQLSSNLALMEASVKSLSTRVIFQRALQSYNQGNLTSQLWGSAVADLQAALTGTQGEMLTLQSIVFPRDGLGSGDTNGLMNVTGEEILGTIELPYKQANGSAVYLGDSGLGYPPSLYPNLNYTAGLSNGNQSATIAQYGSQPLYPNSSILLGPLQLNASFALLSITLPVINNTSALDVLGWISVVIDARLLFEVINSLEGLEETGTVLLIGPDTTNWRFPASFLYDELHQDTESLIQNTRVRFVLPPMERYADKRHADYTYGIAEAPFQLSSYPAILQGLMQNQNTPNNPGSVLSATNEQNRTVSVGFAVPATALSAWILLMEQAQSEVWQPITHLRNVLLACVFGTAGVMLLLILPVAHFSSLPIRRLGDATRNSIDPQEHVRQNDNDGVVEKASSSSASEGKGPGAGERAAGSDDSVAATKSENGNAVVIPSKHFGLAALMGRRKRQKPSPQRDLESFPRAFRIPGKVKDGRHLFRSELTDLTQTFNEMSDELSLYYARLEERVKQRTSELEISKKAAEAANESKTLFIANISHELKTPLNGILGMCAVCMQEDDLPRIKHSLGIIYKSGDLLHNLLTDLLTFSKNEVGQQLSLEEKEFRLSDVGSQLHAIFDIRSTEGRINFTISYEGWHQDLGAAEDAIGSREYGPNGTGRVKDMCVWGDYHRILQVAINLVSNSLKFTPPGGSVSFKIRCLGGTTDEHHTPSRRTSMQSDISRKGKPGKSIRSNLGSKTNSPRISPHRTAKVDNANDISPVDYRRRPSLVSEHSSGSPSDTQTFMFDFEVQDTGPGIPKHLQQQIFEPFVQGDLRLTKKFGGTGLGLSICSQLAKLMHGSVTLESEVDVGSKFTLKIPLKHLRNRADSSATSFANISRTNSASATLVSPPLADSSAGQVTSASFEPTDNPRLVGLSQPYFTTASPPMATPNNESFPSKGNKLRVLVAEDNKVNQEVVLRMLRLEDVFDVHIAKDGQEALDKVKESMEAQQPYDLVFMDVQMPILDGRQSTRLIREIGYKSPIVALTAFADEINQKECLDSGMNYFLAKPIRRPALKHVLKTYCTTIPEVEEADAKMS